jgi:hypothetical protein
MKPIPILVSRRCCSAEAGDSEERAPDYDRATAIFLEIKTKLGLPGTDAR